MSENVAPTNETLYTTLGHKTELKESSEEGLLLYSNNKPNKPKTINLLKKGGLDDDYYRSIINECEKNKDCKHDDNDDDDIELEENIGFEDEMPILNHSIKDLHSKIKFRSNIHPKLI